MPLTIRELLASLPETSGAPGGEAPAEKAPSAALDVLRERLSRGPVPLGAVRRLSLLGSLQAKVAVAYLFYWIRSWFHDAGERERDLAETHLAVALKLLDSMAYLRGAAMKAGQTLANFPDIVPDEIVETLERLHFEAPPMHYSLIREQLHRELGGDPEDVFEDFEREAFAAASLGQVHRARLKGGEEVAVKVQYPGIGRADDFQGAHHVLRQGRLDSRVPAA